MVQIIDLNFKGLPQAIAAFLVPTDEGPVLIETGPYSTLPSLEAGIRSQGYSPKDIRHVMVTHVHLDHAGAAWYFARNAGAMIYVHPIGVPHLINPERLLQSAKRIYGEQMDSLWGSMEGIPANQVEVMEDSNTVNVGQYEFIARHTPGHASHHIAWQLKEVVFCGDVGGVKVGKGPVMPPCPPPDIDIEEWDRSIEKIMALDPTQLYLTHFGSIHQVDRHLSQLHTVLSDWSQWMKDHYHPQGDPQQLIGPFQEKVKVELSGAGMTQAEVEIYEAANPSWMSVYGLWRYWSKQKKEEI